MHWTERVLHAIGWGAFYLCLGATLMVACPARAQAVSSPIGEGLCVQLGAVNFPAQVSELVEGAGGYCSLSGCYITGRVTIKSGATVSPTLRLEGAAYPASGHRCDFLMDYDNNFPYWNCAFRTTGNIFSGGYVGSTTYVFSSQYVSASTYVLANTYFQSTGVAFASLPTCNAGQAGSTEHATDVPCLAYCDGVSGWRCIATTGAADAGTAVTSGTVVSLGQADSPTGAVDSTTNGHILGQAQSATVRYLTGGISAAGTGAGRTIQFECTGSPSGKRCLADISCTNTTHGFDGGVLFTVPFFGYGGASNCQFSGDIVRCLGRNTPVDGGTDCTADPVFLINNLSIEGTYP